MTVNLKELEAVAKDYKICNANYDVYRWETMKDVFEKTFSPNKIVELLAIIRKQNEALKPFVDEFKRYEPNENDPAYKMCSFVVSDLRHAAEAYDEMEK